MRALAAAAVIAAAAFPTAAGAASSRPAIAFQQGGWIWRSAVDGSHRRRVVRGETPSFSPDGRWILFVRRFPRTHQAEVRLLPARGRTSRALYRFEDGLLTAARWLPDSRRILVLRPDGTYLGGVDRPVLVPFALPSGGLWGPQWVAFPRDGELWLAREDGSEAHAIPGPATLPLEWSRDGARLLALEPGLHASRLWIVDAEAGLARPLTAAIPFLVGGSLSRDGTRALVVTDRPFGRGSCHVFRTVAGGALRRVLTGPCAADWNA
jgi:hypothetical protein